MTPTGMAPAPPAAAALRVTVRTPCQKGFPHIHVCAHTLLHEAKSRARMPHIHVAEGSAAEFKSVYGIVARNKRKFDVGVNFRVSLHLPNIYSFL